MKSTEQFHALGFTLESDRQDVARSLLPVVIVAGFLASIVELWTHHYFVAAVAGLTSLCGLPVWWWSDKSTRWKRITWYFWLIFLFVILIGANTQLDRLESLIWSPLTPLLFFLLAGGQLGAVLSGVGLLLYSAGYVSFSSWSQREPVHIYEFLQVIGVYLTTSLLAYRYEKIYRYNRNLLIVQADQDFLTKLLNRRGMQKYLQSQQNYARNTQSRFCVAMFDLDNFKSINDRFGHDAGDKVLCKAAEVLRECVRANDSIGRWGGEEFALILNSVSLEKAMPILEKVRACVSNTDFGLGERVTVSIGVTEYRVDDQVDDLIKRADVALYQAKEAGKDRIVAG